MTEYSASKLKILDAALELFASKGYRSASMADVADAVGIRKASLYSHFKSKVAIFEVILDYVIDKHRQEEGRILDVWSEGGAIGKLNQVFRDYINYCRGNRNTEFWIRFYYFPPEELAKRIRETTRKAEEAFGKRLLGIVKQGIEDGEIKPLNAKDIADSYYFLLVGFLTSLEDYKTKSPKRDIDRCLAVFLQGIAS